jgi:hypothetical protein
MMTNSSQWCLVGNIKDKAGTKHFSAGAKVYCLPAQWGDGYEKITVVAKHRGSGRLVKMVFSSSWITNWRAQVVYSPSVLELLAEETRNWQSKEEVLEYVGAMLSRAEG